MEGKRPTGRQMMLDWKMTDGKLKAEAQQTEAAQEAENQTKKKKKKEDSESCSKAISADVKALIAIRCHSCPALTTVKLVEM